MLLLLLLFNLDRLACDGPGIGLSSSPSGGPTSAFEGVEDLADGWWCVLDDFGVVVIGVDVFIGLGLPNVFRLVVITGVESLEEGTSSSVSAV